MSGIYGFCTDDGNAIPDRILDSMKDAIPAYDQTVDTQWVTKTDHCVGLGTRHPMRAKAPQAYAYDSVSGVRCIVDGVIYPEAAGPAHGLIEMNAAQYLLSRYLESGPSCVMQLNGSFNVAWWDERSERLVIANDRIGHRLFFFGHCGRSFAFASYLARVMGSGLIDPDIDLEGFADLLNYGYIFGERTLFENVKTLPPAGILIFENGKSNVERYWKADEIEPHGVYNEQRLDDVQDAFQTAIKRGFRTDVETALDLTGGLDSRTLLAGAASLDLPYITHTGGQPDSTDVVLAQNVSDAVDVQHCFEPIGPEKVSEWLIPMVLHLGGMVATLHGHPCQHFERPMPFDVAIQGSGTSFIRGFWRVTEDNSDVDDPETVRRHLQSVLQSSLASRISIETLWQDKHRDLAASVKNDRIPELLRQFKAGSRLVDAVTYIHLTEQCRKFLNKAILIIRNVREVYFPLLDHELLVTLAKIPPSVRLAKEGRRIELDLMRRLCPKLLDIPYEKTLIRPSATAAEEWVIHKLRGVNRRLTRWAKLPDWTPRKVPAHYFSRWIRHEMKDTLEGLLCTPDAAFRQYLDAEQVDELVRQHFSGEANNEQFLAGLVVFEICHRLWVDPDPDIISHAFAARS